MDIIDNRGDTKPKPYEVDAAKAFHFNFKNLKNLDEAEQTAALDSIERGFQMGESTDPLTGLDNRAGATIRLDQLYKTLKRGIEDIGIAVYLVDVNKLKPINDELGHPAGNELLLGVSRVLREASKRPEDVIARVGGDEYFFAGGRKLSTPEDEDAVVQRIFEGMENLRQEFKNKYPNLPEGTVSLSIGRVVFTLEEMDKLMKDNPGKNFMDLVIPNADVSMYQAKGQAHNTNGNVFMCISRVGSRTNSPR